MQAARWHLLEPRLQLGLSHLLLGKASRARDVLKTARGQLAGRGAALGDTRGGRGGGCAASSGWRRQLLGWWSPRSPRPPSLLSIRRGSGGEGISGLSCQQVQLQLLLPRPPQSSPLSTKPQGRHSPPTLQMRKRHFRNWPTVPANTGPRRRRRGPAPRPGPPQGTQGRAWAQLSSRHCLSTWGRAHCQLRLQGARSAQVAVLTHLRTIQQTSTQKGQSQWPALDRTTPI